MDSHASVPCYSKNMRETVRSLHVAAVQMANCPAAVAANLGKAAELVAQAVGNGAELVLLPELMATGYRMARDMWETAEPIGGIVSTWLFETARLHRIHIGTTILEADDGDFYNSFLLANPNGTLAGTVRKSDPAWVEARYYRGELGSHVIDTDIGRIGVGICYENYRGEHVRSLAASSIDLLLQPTAAPTPPPEWPVGRRGADAFNMMLETLAQRHALMLGVPVVMANLCGALASPLPGWLGSLNTTFPGLSTIVDCTGDTVAMLPSEEGIIDGTVMVGHRGGNAIRLPEGAWSVPMPWYAPFWPIVQRLSARAYQRDRSRKEAASRLSSSRFTSPD